MAMNHTIDASIREPDHKYHFSYIKNANNTVKAICEPLIETHAFKRLKNAQFMGILSSKFNMLTTRLLIHAQTNRYSVKIDDETRFEHSIGVAYLAYRLSKNLNFSEMNSLYVTCWGLLHDISSWPLSHTGEAAFSFTTNVKSSELRQHIITGAKNLPEEYSVKHVILDMGLLPEVVLQLFEKKPSPSLDRQLQAFWQIIHSPMTPDTIEGVWRAGKHYGMKSIPRPDDLIESYNADLFGMPQVDKAKIPLIKQFWNKKSELYDTFINNEEMVRWESACSQIIIEKYKKLTLIETLEIKESEILNNIAEWIPGIDSTVRYKRPLKYVYDVKIAKKMNRDPQIKYLKDFLRRSEL